ncbi:MULTISPECIES: response regulator [Sphingomonas]|jgi:DNA-binding response OmpR family regulator|uniref:CheY-like chemotaxis protein n=1 Tax=Sphingomonas aerolata TaxID=185951 RepID=A0A2T4YNB8_9SPHN|nr:MULTISPECIES: response regulator [Sphingomonas]RZM32450.1 MAG: response regulator [Sphingomonas sp.]KHA64177.1 sensory transduction regulatory protein [Sphingomonas sp. Ant20]KQM91984.1 transcriptional regulator [Sphingomonas sp. Leaf226]KQN20223.1 transcriptional regulator [Sphingomonas sp. Leaf30]MBB3587468.1 DNA-binding response OmpR family regulator [Sphingomonas sp. BK481]
MNVPQQILIVEDEPLIAMMLEDFLEVLDKGVAGSVDTVADALHRISAGGVDAAILDVNLRGGEKSTPIAERLAEGGIPFVFATGGGDDGLDPRFRDRPRLQKPFTMDGVAKALESL